MKLTAAAPALFLCSLAATAVANPVQQRDSDAVLYPVSGLSSDFVPKKSLLAHKISSFSAPSHQYDAESWADYVLGICESGLAGCTGTASYLGEELSIL